ncbi:MAG: lipopolysaccharide biosynthesis protein, partial [Elusimicrobiota bacterium]|nr:lipopolysaccharide biosynthesis protein [Elusimicrobiota bacterium]
NSEKIFAIGFETAKPILAVEKLNKFRIVLDSYFVMSYLDGIIPEKDDINKVFDLLKKIHKKGFLHGDVQIDNFMISKDKNNLYVLDAKLKKSFWGKIDEYYEYLYLDKSYNFFYNEPLNLYDKNNIYFKTAKFVDDYFECFSRTKKYVKKKLFQKKM